MSSRISSDNEKAAAMVGGQYNMILIATMRARELRNGDKSKLVKPDAQDGPCVTALKEIAEGVVGKEYLSIRKYRR